MPYTPAYTDYELSPYTGLTRKSWIDAAKWMLGQVFDNIRDFKDPVVMPRTETVITYPHAESEGVWRKAEEKAEIFEGLTRSLFIAAPLIKDDPDLVLNGYRVADYYKSHILRVCTPDDPLSVGTYEDLYKMTGCTDPVRPFQQTVESCALVIGLWESSAAIWDTYTQDAKDTIAKFLTSYAHTPTVPQNWRLFNMLDMAFLHMNGYEIDREIMMDHAQAILGYYAGDGWYRDGHSFDYYSCWAFNVYAPLWNLWYGYENAPAIAAKYEEYSNALMENYANFFDKDGWTNMWGRSNIYRFASTSSFPANAFLKTPKVDYGLARRICSGSLLQFTTRDDFLANGVPTMGFYGQFAPLVQCYSCAESPLWLGKAFICLDLPEDHPFWTEKENNGSWEEDNGLGSADHKVTVISRDGPGLCTSNHNANGTTILRTGKVLKMTGDIHGMWNYSKLAYNTKYPWEAAPEDTGCESMQYLLTDPVTNKTERANMTLWGGLKEGVLYRRQFFDYSLEEEFHWDQAINLADFDVPYGIMRADRIRLYKEPVNVTLGSYGFPDNKTVIFRMEEDGAKAIILKGVDRLGRLKQLAMTVYDGWEDLDIQENKGTNPDSESSLVIYASASYKKLYGSAEPYVLISQVITKESHEDFEHDEIFPIKEIKYSDPMNTGGSGLVSVKMKDGGIHAIDYSGLEGRLMI
ncbi:MAG: DUF2264 domain-containing protein [Lachnospiraceae bacterium]|nr:DUF2264 domain-containing protein [Lachnospiraceae bacterium]